MAELLSELLKSKYGLSILIYNIVFFPTVVSFLVIYYVGQKIESLNSSIGQFNTNLENIVRLIISESNKDIKIKDIMQQDQEDQE